MFEGTVPNTKGSGGAASGRAAALCPDDPGSNLSISVECSFTVMQAVFPSCAQWFLKQALLLLFPKIGASCATWGKES